MTTKGEAIALGIAQMSTLEMGTCDHGVVAKVKRCIMERDLYPRRWGLGPVALEKKKLKADGKLDKFGRPNEATPSKWTAGYQDFSAAGQQTGENAAAVQSEGEPMAVEPTEVPTPAKKTEEDNDAEEKDGKRKKSKHEGETAEEKAERKRRKKEKKAAKKAAGGKDDGSDSD
jgi:H/ACA ribonucleoprotein complex subunit 4